MDGCEAVGRRLLWETDVMVTTVTVAVERVDDCDGWLVC